MNETDLRLWSRQQPNRLRQMQCMQSSSEYYTRGLLCAWLWRFGLSSSRPEESPHAWDMGAGRRLGRWLIWRGSEAGGGSPSPSPSSSPQAAVQAAWTTEAQQQRRALPDRTPAAQSHWREEQQPAKRRHGVSRQGRGSRFQLSRIKGSRARVSVPPWCRARARTRQLWCALCVYRTVPV
jgi:hypothetical protein